MKHGRQSQNHVEDAMPSKCLVAHQSFLLTVLSWGKSYFKPARRHWSRSAREGPGTNIEKPIETPTHRTSPLQWWRFLRGKAKRLVDSTVRNLGTLHQHASCSCHALRGNAVKLHPLNSSCIPLSFGFTSNDGAHL